MGWLVLLAVLAGAGGCGTHRPVIKAGPGPVTEHDLLWRAAQDVLREYRFTLDRLDRGESLITTMPMTGQSWLEFWRRDAATAYDLAESSLHTIYRRALVRLEPADGPGGYDVNVEVEVARSNRRTRPVMNTSEALVQLQLVQGTQAWEMYMRPQDAPGLPPPRITPLPNDPNLAARIRAAILARAERLRRGLPSGQGIHSADGSTGS